MGGTITRNVKEKVIREWLQGIRRETIAKMNNIAVGTVTNIIKEASLQKEYHDMTLFRHVAVMLNENGLEPVVVGFAIRIMKIMEDNGIELDQLESIISDYATYCYKLNLSVDDFIQSTRECLNLSSKLGISVEKIPEYIIQGKKVIDNLEEQRQDLLRNKQRLREELDTLINQIEEYGKEKLLIEQIEELARELHKRDERDRQNEQKIELLRSQLANERRGSRTLDELNADLTSKLSLCQEELKSTKVSIPERGLKH